jgi:hypothetical protein
MTWKNFSITAEESARIENLVREIWSTINDRCKAGGANDHERSAALYSIQDFLGGIDIDGDGVRL